MKKLIKLLVGLTLALAITAGCVGAAASPTATATPTPGSTPDWLTAVIQRLQHEPVANPPASIVRYVYKGQTVYYLPPRCCDIFSDLYDASGNLIAHPDGGITGKGDGRAPDFSSQRSNESVVWKDQRTVDPGLTQTPAPIQSVDVLTQESNPPQYTLVVVSGLQNTCIRFAGYRFDPSANKVEVINWKPVSNDVICGQVYSTVETRIPLGSNFKPGMTYTIQVNDVEHTFTAQ